MHDAFHDGLTGLANRNFFIQRLELAVANKLRHHDNQFALLFIDLDRFKLINDTLGHQAGDALLIEVSQRLKLCIRDHDTLARFGGDEFVILLENYRSDHDIDIVSKRILDALNEPFMHEGKPMHSGASLGVAPLTTQYRTADEALRDADVAMYQAKSRGRGQAVLFNHTMREELDEAVALESEFRSAMEDQLFECFLYPIIDMANNRTLMYQCSIRWYHPTLGKIKREKFWQIAEQSKLTADIDNLLLDQCIDYLLKHQGGTHNLVLALNLSMNYLTQPHMTEALIARLRQANISLEQLAFTFSERQWQYQPNLLKNAMKRLKREGIMVILDNFGAGSAAINDLFIYPFDMIKIDKQFCQALPRSQRDGKFIRAVKAITDELHLPLVVEGIDNQAQLDAVNSMGITIGQGAKLAPPQKIYS
jgi:diguanylate cyclase (GGDEF)-like protein